MRVCIVGVGAVGGVFAGWLGRRVPPSELQLCALARGETLSALRERGLRLHDAEGEHQITLEASDHAEELGQQDLVILAVKGPALADVATRLPPLLAAGTRVLVAMNGVPWWFFDHASGPCAGLRLHNADPGGHMRAAVPTQHVLGCVLHFSARVLRPGVVQHASGDGLILGEPAGGSSMRLTEIAALLRRAQFAVTESTTIQRDVWFKLWGNMTINPVSALTQASADRILDDTLVRGFCSAVMLEANNIGRHFGCGIDQTPEQRHAITRKLGAFKTSMLQDLEAGRALELDAITGSVREIGQHLGLTTPHLDALFGLTRLLAQSRGLYPSKG